MIKISILSLVILFSFSFCKAQEKNTQLGSSNFNTKNAMFDYSDPEAVNIKVSVWGAVKYPGKYLIPNYTSVLDLISYAGGPDGNAAMDELKLYRIDKNGKEKLIDFNYNDIVYGDKLEVKNRIVPKLEPGDFLIIPSRNTTSFREYLNIGLQIISVVVSVISIILWSRR